MVVNLFEDVGRKRHVVSDCINMGHLVKLLMLLLKGIRVDRLLKDYSFLHILQGHDIALEDG